MTEEMVDMEGEADIMTEDVMMIMKDINQEEMSIIDYLLGIDMTEEGVHQERDMILITTLDIMIDTMTGHIVMGVEEVDMIDIMSINQLFIFNFSQFISIRLGSFIIFSFQSFKILQI